MIFFGLKYFLGMFSSLSLSFLSITIVNIALFALNFLNLPQGNILTKAEKHYETLKDDKVEGFLHSLTLPSSTVTSNNHQQLLV